MIENTNLTILYSTPSISRLYTGVYEVEKNIVLNLNTLGVNFEIHSIIDQFTSQDLHFWKSIDLFLYNNYGPFKVGYSPLLMKNVLKSNADVGHLHSLWSYTSYVLYKWAKKNSKPYLLSVNAYLFDSALKRSKIKKNIALNLVFRKIINSASCIQVNTLNEYQSVRSLGFKNPICIIPNGVDIPNIKNIINKPPWEEDVNTSGKKTLLYLSRIHPQKGVDILVDAWKKLFDQAMLFDWHLVIIGFNINPTNFETELMQKVKSNGLSSVITLLPGQYDEMMNASYSNCNAFILPSFNEGTSIAALNALAFSKVTILTKGCNITESFNLNASIQIEPNIESISNGILQLFKMNESEIFLMGLKGRKLVEEKYSWKSVSNNILEIYNWLKNNKKHPIPSSVLID